MASKPPKFKVLQRNRFMSSIFRIDINQQNSPSMNGLFATIPVVLIFFTLFGTWVSCAVRISNESYDFTARLTALSIIIALSQAATMFTNIGMTMTNLAALYQTLQTIVDNEGIKLIEFSFEFNGHINTFDSFIHLHS